jgi:Periplasmic binding protein domain
MRDHFKSLNLDAWVEESSAATLPKPAIPVVVKDTSSLYWQIVQAGARKAGEDLGVNVPELGPPSESDIAGQMRILESTLASKPAAIVIAPVEFATHDRKGEHPLRAPAHRQPDERGGRKGLPAPACCSRSRHANPIAILKHHTRTGRDVDVSVQGGSVPPSALARRSDVRLVRANAVNDCF